MNLELPALFLNFKTYEQSTGKNALQLAKKAEEISIETGKTIVLVSQVCDIKLLSENCSLPVFAQHIDPITFGANTGHILPEAVKESGAVGTVINHAENKRSNEFVEKTIVRAKEAGLKVLACAENLDRAKQIAAFSIKPDLIAVEPPELIGSGVSVSNSKPDLILSVVKGIEEIAKLPVLAGAGIKYAEDARKAVELGCSGVFVASAIVKSEKQETIISDILSGLF